MIPIVPGPGLDGVAPSQDHPVGPAADQDRPFLQELAGVIQAALNGGAPQSAEAGALVEAIRRALGQDQGAEHVVEQVQGQGAMDGPAGLGPAAAGVPDGDAAGGRVGDLAGNAGPATEAPSGGDASSDPAAAGSHVERPAAARRPLTGIPQAAASRGAEEAVGEVVAEIPGARRPEEPARPATERPGHFPTDEAEQPIEDILRPAGKGTRVADVPRATGPAALPAALLAAVASEVGQVVAANDIATAGQRPGQAGEPAPGLPAAEPRAAMREASRAAMAGAPGRERGVRVNPGTESVTAEGARAAGDPMVGMVTSPAGHEPVAGAGPGAVSSPPPVVPPSGSPLVRAVELLLDASREVEDGEASEALRIDDAGVRRLADSGARQRHAGLGDGTGARISRAPVLRAGGAVPGDAGSETRPGDAGTGGRPEAATPSGRDVPLEGESAGGDDGVRPPIRGDQRHPAVLRPVAGPVVSGSRADGAVVVGGESSAGGEAIEVGGGESTRKQVAPTDRITIEIGEDVGERASIRVMVRGSTVRATIVHADGHVARGLGANVDDLQRALGRHGFADANVVVRSARPGDSSSMWLTQAGGAGRLQAPEQGAGSAPQRDPADGQDRGQNMRDQRDNPRGGGRSRQRSPRERER